MSDCPLCRPTNEDILWQDDFCRIILAGDADYPGFCRVILNDHVKEMTDLPPAGRQRMMITVMQVEETLRELLRPDKINLASLGNMLPHLHWHVIPRFTDDRHFPDAVWAAPHRAGTAHGAPELRTRLIQALASRLAPAPEPAPNRE